jgi:hypothetical protein
MAIQPPVVATWLLRHFGCSANNDAVIGDLDERYRRGRSRTWYWRQVLSTIVVSFVKEAWIHKCPTFTAIVTGCLVFVVSRYALNARRELLSALATWSKYWRHDWITITVQILETTLSGVLTGWLVARLHNRNRMAMVLTCAAYLTCIQLAWVAHEIRITTVKRPFRVAFGYDIAFIILIAIGILLSGGFLRNRRGGDGSQRASPTVG